MIRSGIYVIKYSEDNIKVGRSKNVESRIR
jgi:hypothetical protein